MNYRQIFRLMSNILQKNNICATQMGAVFTFPPFFFLFLAINDFVYIPTLSHQITFSKYWHRMIEMIVFSIFSKPFYNGRLCPRGSHEEMPQFLIDDNTNNN